MKITFPKKAHLYDVRAKSYLGLTDRVDADLAPGRARLYALLPYKVEKLSLKTETSFRQGQPAEYQLTLSVSNGTPAPHAVRLTVYGPEDKPVDHYCGNVLVEGGTCLGKIPLALSEREGKWRIEATDVISGEF